VRGVPGFTTIYGQSTVELIGTHIITIYSYCVLYTVFTIRRTTFHKFKLDRIEKSEITHSINYIKILNTSRCNNIKIYLILIYI
jgi:hypothetical protein